MPDDSRRKILWADDEIDMLRPHIKFLEQKGYAVTAVPNGEDALTALSDGRFDVVVFFTYLYFPTFFGLPLVRDRAILVPTAHDEPTIYLGIFDKVFRSARYLAFLTPEHYTCAGCHNIDFAESTGT